MYFNILLVSIGGAIGSVGRYLGGMYVQKTFSAHPLFGTFAVNTLGCLLVGFLAGYFNYATMDKAPKALIFVGILGGFTTFSAFAFEVYSVTQEGKIMHAALYTVINVIVCISLVFVGIYLAKLLKNA